MELAVLTLPHTYRSGFGKCGAEKRAGLPESLVNTEINIEK